MSSFCLPPRPTLDPILAGWLSRLDTNSTVTTLPSCILDFATRRKDQSKVSINMCMYADLVVYCRKWWDGATTIGWLSIHTTNTSKCRSTDINVKPTFGQTDAQIWNKPQKKIMRDWKHQESTTFLWGHTVLRGKIRTRTPDVPSVCSLFPRFDARSHRRLQKMHETPSPDAVELFRLGT